MKASLIASILGAALPLCMMSCSGKSETAAIEKTPAIAPEKKESIIDRSRDNAVEILIEGKRAGTGFFIDSTHVITCFHVVGLAQVMRNDDGSSFVATQFRSDIVVKTRQGSIIRAVTGRLPTEQDPTPLLFDYTVLELEKRPKHKVFVFPLARDGDKLNIGDTVYFSGFPLDAPFMLTHKGIVSGMEGDKIGIQAPTNRGNSGSALVSEDGKVFGIVSQREGFMPADLAAQFSMGAPNGGIVINGIDPIQAMHALTGTVDKYISTGIGYAITSKYVRHHLATNRIAGYRPIMRPTASTPPIRAATGANRISLIIRGLKTRKSSSK